MPDIERKQIDMAEVKTLDEGHGGFAGYASTFGNLDRVGDIVLKGAFLDTLETFVKDGFIAASHDWDTAIGYVTEAHEDDHGLWIEVAYHSTDAAQAVRRIITERLAAGKTVSLSIGYRATDYEYNDDGVRLLKAVDLFETSFVTVPANPQATVTEAKAAAERAHDTEDAPVAAKDHADALRCLLRAKAGILGL